MNEKAWTMRHGFAIGAAVIAAGLVLQWAVGAVRWQDFAWPVNIAVLAVFVIAALIGTALSRRYSPLRFLATLPAAVPAICYGMALTMIMGLTRQTADGTWLSDMLTFWPFVLTYSYIAFILALTTLRRLRRLRHPRLSDIAFVLNHAGLLIALLAGTLGNPDMRQLKIITNLNAPERRAMDEEQRIVQMSIAIKLDRFIMETYPDGSPRRFASEVSIIDRDGKNVQATVEVNRPVRIGSWKLYQYGYDTKAGAESRISILELVQDPWLPAVYAGIFMMLGGALLMFFQSNKPKDQHHAVE